MTHTSEKKSVVVIGGGTGIYPVLEGLKEYYHDVSVTALISMTDSGGSTGRLRDEFGQLPVGDVRMALTALANNDHDTHHVLRELFLYRFDKGVGLEGHNFGNLLIVALTEILGSEVAAVQAAARILRVRGKVVPITADFAHLVATYDDGQEVVGEHDIDEPPEERLEHRITALATEPKTHILPEADAAIAAADVIVLGPGDLYTSLLANCVVDGVAEAIQQSSAHFIFFTNLMTKPGQTHGMTAKEHIDEVLRYVGRPPDTVVVNTAQIPQELLARYAASQQYPVVDDVNEVACQIVRAELLDTEPVVKKAGDVLMRSLVRGDAEKMAKIIYDVL